MSASAIRAGQAFVELFTNNNPLYAGLRAAEARVKQFGNAIAGIGAKFAALGGAVLTPLLAAATGYAESGSALLLLSERTGISVEALSSLGYAARQAGVSSEDLETSLSHMVRTLPGAEIEDVARALAAIQQPGERAAKAVEIFGKSGMTMLPLLNRGAEGIRELREEASRMGLVGSKENALQARELGLALANASAAAKGLWRTLGAQVAPALAAALRYALDFVGVIKDWIREHKTLVVVLGTAGVALVGIGSALLLVAGAIKLVALGLGLLNALWALLAGAMTSPLILLGLWIGAVLYFSSLGGKLVNFLATRFAAVGEIFAATWARISEAIASGDWAGALEIAMLGLKNAFLAGLISLRMWWRDFSGFFVDVWQTMITTISAFFGRFIDRVTNGLSKLRLATATNLEAGVNAVAADEQRERERVRERDNQADTDRLAELKGEVSGTGGSSNLIGLLGGYIAKFANNAVSGVGSSLTKTDARGTFSSYALGGLGAGTSAVDRIAKAAEETAQNTRGLGNTV